MFFRISQIIKFSVLVITLISLSMHGMENYQRTHESKIDQLLRTVHEHKGKIIFASGVVTTALLGYKYWSPIKKYFAPFFGFSTRRIIRSNNSNMMGVTTGEIIDYKKGRDYKSVKEILKANWGTLVDGSYSEGFADWVFNTNGSCNSPGNTTTIKVIKVNEQIAGFMTFVKCHNNSGMVELLAVDQNYRRQGFGYELLTEAQNLAQEQSFENLVLYAFTDNKPAINLYEKFGFEKTSNFNDRMLVMKKQLVYK